MMAEAMQKRHNAKLGDVKIIIGPIKGNTSGGTINTVLTIASQPIFTLIKNLSKLRSPYYLIPPESVPTFRQPPMESITYDRDVKSYTGPWFLGVFDRQIILRSNALMGNRYGNNLRIQEGVKFKSWFKAMAASLATTFFLLLVVFPPTRYLLRTYVLPKPGEGPSREKMASSFLKSTIVARSEMQPDGSHHLITGHIHLKQDPGYGMNPAI